MSIDALFCYAGIDETYTDAFGAPTKVSTESKLALLNAFGYVVSDDASAARVLRDAHMADALHPIRPVYVVRAGAATSWPQELVGAIDPVSAPGYYDVELGSDATRVIVAPAQAYVAGEIDQCPLWGIGAQLYALRSEKNWGIGDFGDLARLTSVAARSGASFVGLNPLHQLHLTNPSSASPYSPLSRRFLNALYIDVEDAASEFGADLAGVERACNRESALIDYPGVARAKCEALERIWAVANVERELEAFEAAHPGVRVVALYEAIMEVLRERAPDIESWLQWPAELRNSRSEAVARFCEAHAARVRFYVFLQWLADRQLRRIAQRAAGMPLGLYGDLAVGVDLASADVWADPDAFALGLSIGAPPDALNERGQNWGLPPFHPRALIARAYQPFIELIRANMQYTGALRIDHVMGLKRLFCIPRAYREGGGAYVNYDFEAMLGILALESQRNRCMVVGEDLGTVPEGFRERLQAERIFSCRVLPFERDEVRFFDAATYPADSIASAGTHDLPPFASWWRSAGDASRSQLVDAFEAAGIEAVHVAMDERAALEAAHRFLARTRSRLMLAQMEDLLAQREQVNVPGTTTEEPNWSRKYEVLVEHLESCDIFAAIVAILRNERPLNREAHV